MKDVSKVFLIGRLGHDPVKKESKNGNMYTQFTLATSHKSADQEEFETQWHRVFTYGRQSEVCAQYLTKGQTVFVEGALRLRNYTGTDGVKRTAVEVHADNVTFLGGKAKPVSTETPVQMSA